jgi:hypothetical protein
MRQLQQRLVVVAGTDGLSKEAQRNATVNFLSHLRSRLASKRVLAEYKLNQQVGSDAAGGWLGMCHVRACSIAAAHDVCMAHAVVACVTLPAGTSVCAAMLAGPITTGCCEGVQPVRPATH